MSSSWACLRGLRSSSEGRKVHRYKYLSDLHYLSRQARHGYVVRWSLIPTYQFSHLSLFLLESEEGGHTVHRQHSATHSDHRTVAIRIVVYWFVANARMPGPIQTITWTKALVPWLDQCGHLGVYRQEILHGQPMCTVHSFVTSIGSKGRGRLAAVYFML